MRLKIFKTAMLILLLILVLLPIVLIPLSFFRNPDIIIFHNPSGFTVENAEKYNDSTTFVTKYKTGIYAVNAGFLGAVGFDFVIGKDFDSGIIERGDAVVAVSKTYALEEFLSTDVLGRPVEINGMHYKVCAVFDDEVTLFESIAGIDFSEIMFIPYTSVASYCELKINNFICVDEIPEELSLYLIKTKSTDLHYYKDQLRITQAIMILALTGIVTVVNLVHSRKSNLKWFWTIVIFVILMLTINIAGRLPANTLPIYDNVFDAEFYTKVIIDRGSSLLNGSMNAVLKLFYINRLTINIYMLVVGSFILWINRALIYSRKYSVML